MRLQGWKDTLQDICKPCQWLDMLTKQDSLEFLLGMGYNVTQSLYGIGCNVSRDLAQWAWMFGEPIIACVLYVIGCIHMCHMCTYGMCKVCVWGTYELHIICVMWLMDSQTRCVCDMSRLYLYTCITVIWWQPGVVAMSISSMSWDCEPAVSTLFAIPRQIADIYQTLFLWSHSKPNKLQLSTCARTSNIHKRDNHLIMITCISSWPLLKGYVIW
jgi:hypothetical protein